MKYISAVLSVCFGGPFKKYHKILSSLPSDAFREPEMKQAARQCVNKSLIKVLSVVKFKSLGHKGIKQPWADSFGKKFRRRALMQSLLRHS